MIKNKADQVVGYITEWLRSGEFQVGDKLPSERRLSEMLGVSLLTVNKAMSRLEDAALLSRSAGKGTHVTSLPSPDAIAVICDIIHTNRARHPSSMDLLVEGLLKAAKDAGIIPHFLIGQGKSSSDFLDSLGFRSSAWNNIKGVVAIAWKAGLETILEERSIPLVTICTKHESKNTIIFNYEKLGRIAAVELLRDNPERIHIVHNEEFSQFEQNNPLPAFFAEAEKHGYAKERIILVPSDVSRDAGYKVAEMLADKAEAILFTDENICEGYGEWIKQHKSTDFPSQRVITQTTSGLDIAIPETYDRLEFNIDDVCLESLKLLCGLYQSPVADTKNRLLIDPVLIRGNQTTPRR